MERDHAVEKQDGLAFGNHLGLAVRRDENWKLLEMCAKKVPGAFFCSRFKLKPTLQATIRLVRGDDQVFVDSFGV